MINSASEQESLSSISSAADKIPPFWVQDPELWFYHIETVFKGDKIINSKTKFQILISKIQIDVLVPVRDVIKCPGDKPYEKIKSKLISTYLESETRRIQQLLEGKNLGNRKPSQLLKLIIKLAGYGTATGVVKTLWMKYLPQNIHSILTSTGLEDINKLAEFADKLQEALAPEMDSVVNQGCSFYYLQDEEYLIEEEAALEAKIIDLSRQIALMSSVIKLNQSRTYNNGSGRDLQINNDYSNCMCYYHFKFGEKARKCSTPCSWVRANHTSYNELQEPLW